MKICKDIIENFRDDLVTDGKAKKNILGAVDAATEATKKAEEAEKGAEEENKEEQKAQESSEEGDVDFDMDAFLDQGGKADEDNKAKEEAI